MTTAVASYADQALAQSQITAQFFRGLSDPTRVWILRILLHGGPTRVGDIVEAIGAPQSRISSHLACLRTCGFVTSVREGKNVCYEISDPRVKNLIELGDSVVAGNAERILACQVTGGRR